jgi:hypothetical protein
MLLDYRSWNFVLVQAVPALLAHDSETSHDSAHRALEHASKILEVIHLAALNDPDAKILDVVCLVGTRV